MAVMLGRKEDTGNMLSQNWYIGFMKRNNLKLRRPVKLELIRARGCNIEAIKKYFDDYKVIEGLILANLAIFMRLQIVIKSNSP